MSYLLLQFVFFPTSFPLYIHPIFDFLISVTLDQVIFPSISHLPGFFYHYLSYSLQHLSASVWHLFFYSSSSHYRRIHPFSVDPTFLSFFPPLTLRLFLSGLYIEKWVMMLPGKWLTDFKILQIFHFGMLPSCHTWIKVMTLLSVLTSWQSYSLVLAQLMRSKEYSCHIWRSHCIAAEGSCLLGC